MQLPGLTENSAIESVEALARRYIEKIRNVQAAGPYRLLGWSIGGVIAHAMATALTNDGNEVELLAMMDSYAPPISLAGDVVAAATAEVLHQLDITVPDDVSRETLIDRMAAATNRPGHYLHGFGRDRIRRWYEVIEQGLPVMQDHLPSEYNGEVVYFTAARQTAPSAGRASWHPYLTGRVTDHLVDCSHNDMCNPDALQTIALILNPYFTNTRKLIE